MAGVNELESLQEGDSIRLRPVRPSWSSLADLPLADCDFLQKRPELMNEGRFSFTGDEPGARYRYLIKSAEKYLHSHPVMPEQAALQKVKSHF